DLKILSSLSPKTCEVRLYGTVIPGTKVTATDGQGQTLEAISEVGSYEIKGVKANVEYTVQAHLPDYLKTANTNPQQVRINPCGWAIVDFYAIYDGSISGRVTGPDGAPVNKAVVELTSSKQKSIWSGMSAISDSQGRFELHGLTPGTYLLGINITREPDED